MKEFQRRRIVPYLYIAPAMFFLILVYAYPIIQSFKYSLLDAQDRFTGFSNYRYLLGEDPIFWTTVWHNFVLLATIPLLVGLSVAVAAFLHERICGWRLYRFAIFVPYVLSITVAGIIFSYVFRLNGILNYILGQAGLSVLARDWLGQEKTALGAVMSVIIWRELGFGVILFLARLLSVPNSLYEVAEVEGASRWQTLRHVSLPQLKGVIEFFVIIEAINLFSWVFNYVYVMTGGGPGRSTYVLELYVYNLAFRFGMMGMASAVSVIIFLVVCALVGMTIRIRQREEW